MSGTWAILQMTQLENGKGQLAEGFIVAHSLDGEMRAREIVREVGGPGEVYAIVDLAGPLYRVLADAGRLQRVNTRGEPI